MLKIRNRLKVTAFSLFLLTIVVSGRANAQGLLTGIQLGIDSYKYVQEKVLNFENSTRAMVMNFFVNGPMDAVSQFITGCPLDGLVDVCKNVPTTCTFNLLGTGSVGIAESGLLGFATTAMDSVTSLDTPPVNMASFWQNMKAESLIFRETRAQFSVTLNPFLGPLNGVLNVWITFRNIAFGLLAIFVLIVAIMISMKTKIDPQTVVTAQAAIPRLIISALLIAFSYALGAFFMQAIIPLMGLAIGLPTVGFATTALSTSVCSGLTVAGTPTNMTGWMQLIVGKAIKILQVLPVAPVIGLIVIIALVVLIIFLVAMVFVFVTRYVKMVALTIFAPLIFSLGAIPGQEHRIKDWFKDMAASALAIPAMVLLFFVGIIIFLATAWDTGAPGTLFLSATLAPVVGAMLMVALWIQALRVPGMIERALKGPVKR